MKILLSWIPKEFEIEFFRKCLKSFKIELAYPKKNRYEELKKLIKDSDILISGYVPSEIIKKGEKLKLIQTLGAGADSFDFNLLRQKKIILATASGSNAIPVAEFAFGLILTLAKKICLMNNAMKNNKWIPYSYETMSKELYGKTIGIIGLGKIGKEIAKRANAFGMKVLAIKKDPKKVPKDIKIDFIGGPKDIKKILSLSDFVVLTIPLTKETKGMIGEEELKLMKKDAFLINVSRGKVIDEDALYKALKDKWIKGAGIDVWWYYPPNFRFPSKNKIHLLSNVIATPHKAGWTLNYRYRAFKIACENIKRFLNKKELLNVVDFDKEY